MAHSGGEWILQLPRGAGKRDTAQRFVVCGGKRSSVAASVIDSNGHATDALPTSTYQDPEMRPLTLRIASRHIPKAGAVCGSSALTDLCGGRQVTAVPTATVVLAIVLDLSARRIVGWALSHKPDANLVIKALDMAYEQRGRPQGLLFHSDQGPIWQSPVSPTALTLPHAPEHEPSWKLLG